MACFGPVRARLSVILSVVSVACSEPPPAKPEPAPAPKPITQPAEQPAAKIAPRSSALRQAVAVPANGCAIELAQRVAAGTRGVALRLGATESVLVASDDALTLWQLGDSFREGPRSKLDAPIARASAACGKDACELALIDQKARLLYTRLDDAIHPLKELARGVDRRFAPAVAQQGERALIAYVATVDEVMHTMLLGVRAGIVEPTTDVTPASHGATAPTFLLGASTPTLIAIDAHAGISPLLELPLDGTGKPKQTWVRTPVSQPFEPPQLAAVQWPGGEAEVMFTVIGKLAMSAIGRIPLRRAASIEALSPSRGYGMIEFALAPSSRRALFACEVPVSAAPKSERKLELTLSDGKRNDPGPVIDAPATAPSLVRTRDGYLLAYSRGADVHAALLRCSD
jgi:hypothetical protein